MLLRGPILAAGRSRRLGAVARAVPGTRSLVSRFVAAGRRRLAEGGSTVRIFTLSGSARYGYLPRYLAHRLAERPANVRLVLRAVPSAS